MRARLIAVSALVAGLLVASSSPSRAGHHLWRLTHAYSNAAGTVQFVQLFVNADSEAGVGPFTLTADGTRVFNFVTNLPSTATANPWILLGTSNLPTYANGLVPDYIIPANFLSTGGGTINYANVDTWTYGALPTDGVHELLRADGSTPVNSATNFAKQTASVVLPAPPVPAATTWSLALLVGALLLVASGLLRKRGLGRRTTPAV